MSQPRTPVIASHDHPLSPPLDAPNDGFLPDLRSDLLSSRPGSSAPLFPASPPADSPTNEFSRRGSAATLLARSNSLYGGDGGIGLGLPRATSRSGSEERPQAEVAAGRRSRAASSSSSLPSVPLPRHLSLPSAPHALPPAALDSLPLSHLVALTQALSAQLEEAQSSLREGRAELQALKTLAAEKGAGEGEIERAQVRARTELREKEGRGGSLSKARKARAKGKASPDAWTIELPMRESSPSAEVPAQVEVDLDIEDLTEAISSNTFDLGLSNPDPVEMSDTASVRSHAVSLPLPTTTADEDKDKSDTMSVTSQPLTTAEAGPQSLPPAPLALPSTSKSVRPRHASLSARFVGYIAGAPSSSATSAISHPPAGPSSSPPVRSSLIDAPSPKKRSVRADSIQSVSSTASGRAGYSEWLGWKSWGPRATSSIREGKPNETKGDVRASSDAVEQSEGATDNVAEGYPVKAGTDARSAPDGRPRGLSDASTAAPSLDVPPSPSSSRRTSLTRSTIASTLPTSQPPSPPMCSRVIDPVTPSNLKDVSSERRRSTASSPSLQPPDSPTLVRTRSPGPPPAMFSSATQGAAEAVLSTPLTTSTISAPAPATPNRLRGRSSLPATPSQSPPSHSAELPIGQSQTSTSTREPEDADDATLKARSNRTKEPRPAFVPGVPLYSAPPDSMGKPATTQPDASYVAVARGTLSRALGLGASTTTAASVPSTSHPSSTSAASAGEPNLTLFPQLPSLSLSRYSPFAQPALSTPATHVSLSASTSALTAASSVSGASQHPSSSLIPHTATLASIPSGRGGAQTMELDTISAEAAPPSLALLKPSYQSAASAQTGAGGKAGIEEDDGEGPMIDRYGFIYDVRVGMELLKESRRRKDGQNRKRGSHRNRASSPAEGLTALGTLAPSQEPAVEALLTPPTELEVQPQLDALREAIGITPTSEAENMLSLPATPERGPSPTPATGPADLPRRPAKLVRDPSDTDINVAESQVPGGDSATATTGPQSMRALLAQLRSMTDAVDKVQQDAWDAFIRRRQAKLAKLRAHHPSDVLNDEASSGAGVSGHGGRERRKSAWLAAVAPDDPAGAGRPEEGEESWTSENLVGVAQMGTEKKGKKEDWNDFKALVRKGIPITYRPKIWGECSSANEAREPGVYQELLAQAATPAEAQCLKQIDMDCHRTFPTNVFFAGNGPGVAKLRNVLVAYSRRNPKIGYCQGMNNLVATLLLTHPAEEDAFWVLVCIIENILPSDYYTSHLLVSRADQQVLQDLVARILPKLAAHLEEQGVELTAISFGWFLSLFTDSLPIQTLLRVWDLFFIHGTIFLFRVALAILKLHEPELLACDSAASLYALLGQLPAGLWNADRLLKVACEDLAASVKDREVSGLRSKHVPQLQEEMGLEANGEGEGAGP